MQLVQPFRFWAVFRSDVPVKARAFFARKRDGPPGATMRRIACVPIAHIERVWRGCCGINRLMDIVDSGNGRL